MKIVSVQNFELSKKFSLYEATSDGMQRIIAITPSAILLNYSPLYFLVWK